MMIKFILLYWFFTCLGKQILPAVCLDNCAYRTANKQWRDYLDKNLIENN